MINEQEYEDLKQEVEQAKEEAARAQGALDQLMTRLHEEFKCKSVADARDLLEEYKARRDKAAREYKVAMSSYTKQWKRTN